MRGGQSGERKARQRFARDQRLALEDYLLRLIRVTMFRPEANRCVFSFSLFSRPLQTTSSKKIQSLPVL